MTSEEHDHHADKRRYDAIYSRSRGQAPEAVPWAHGAPHPLFESWIDATPTPGSGRNRALVIASGLGDDAEALAARGWDVTAFDASPQAIEWTRERFPHSTVDYHVRNLFALPPGWHHRFDLVVEVHTVQALPVTRRQAAIETISATVAPEGLLVVVAMTRDVTVPLRGYPLPLTSDEVASFARYGLVETERYIDRAPTASRPGRARLVLTRPGGD